jgi:geranylgeranyl diphosphate synthase type I
VAKLAEYGQNLGMAFQIQDDYLGIWGEPALTGKSAASDLLARKKTLPVLYGLRECEGFRQQWEISDPTPQQIAAMAGMLQACGAGDYVKTQAAGYTHQAFEALAALFPDGNEDAAALQALTEGLLHRQV